MGSRNLVATYCADVVLDRRHMEKRVGCPCLPTNFAPISVNNPFFMQTRFDISSNTLDSIIDQTQRNLRSIENDVPLSNQLPDSPSDYMKSVARYGEDTKVVVQKLQALLSESFGAK